MIFDPILDLFRGRAITIPPLDGALRANTVLDDATAAVELAAAALGRFKFSAAPALYWLSDGIEQNSKSLRAALRRGKS